MTRSPAYDNNIRVSGAVSTDERIVYRPRRRNNPGSVSGWIPFPAKENVLSIWQFNNSLEDDAGSNDLTANDGTPVYVASAGGLGKGLQFDGSLYLSKTAPTNLSPTDRFTIGLVGKFPVTTTAQNVVHRLGSTEGWAFFFKELSPTILSMSLNGGYASANSTGTIDDGNLKFLAVTYDKDLGGSEELKLYIDGVQDGSDDYSTAIDYIPAPDLGIGAGATGNSPVVNGTIMYQVVVWDVALSVLNIESWRNKGFGVSY